MKPSDIVQLHTTFSLQSNLQSRLEQAYIYSKDDAHFNDNIFPYQEFSLSLHDLLDIALGKEILPHKYHKVERCFEHMLFHKQEGHTYWPYQFFSCSLFEILEACMKKINPSSIKEIKQDMHNFHKEYLAITSLAKKSITDSFIS